MMLNLYFVDTYGENHSVLEEIDIDENQFLHMQRNIIKSYALSDPPKQKKGDFYKIKHSDIKTYSPFNL